MTKYAFVLEPSEHAELSASSADRWTYCPGSVALSTGIPNRASHFAAAGSAGHYIGAECLKDGGSPRRWLGTTAKVEDYEVDLDEDLIDAVQEYVDDCREDTLPGDAVFIEQSFTPALKKLHPKLGGSGDRVRWRQSTRQLRVTDLKLGAGVAVEVDDNQQLKIYALGALVTNAYNAEEVELRIVQPRCEHADGRARSYKFPAFDLLDFAADLIEAAKRTEEFDAALNPSKKACKWCPAAAANKCPAIEKQSRALVDATFSSMALEHYSREQIAEFLTKAPLVEQRISAIREFAYQQALHHGVDFPGWKIVEKRASRHWTDEEEARKAFQSVPGAMKEPELRSPPQIEKLLGKKKFAALRGGLVEKKSSGYVLAPAEDNRPAAAPALKVLELFEPEAPEQS